jgi:hypothetical protein
MPHSAACWTIFQECACSSSAFVGNAAPDQTRAAERLLALDDGGLQSELARTNGGHVAAGAGADDNEIVSLGHGLCSPRNGLSA